MTDNVVQVSVELEPGSGLPGSGIDVVRVPQVRDQPAFMVGVLKPRTTIPAVSQTIVLMFISSSTFQVEAFGGSWAAIENQARGGTWFDRGPI